MKARPPRSPLLPYTTLSRSRLEPRRGDALDDRLQRGLVRVEVGREAALVADGRPEAAALERALERVEDLGPHPQRSEEHTSELQSRQYLVCRLLLEKKTKIA